MRTSGAPFFTNSEPTPSRSASPPSRSKVPYSLTLCTRRVSRPGDLGIAPNRGRSPGPSSAGCCTGGCSRVIRAVTLRNTSLAGASVASVLSEFIVTDVVHAQVRIRRHEGRVQEFRFRGERIFPPGAVSGKNEQADVARGRFLEQEGVNRGEDTRPSRLRSSEHVYVLRVEVIALDEDQPQVSDVVDRTVQGRKGPPGLFGGGRLTVLRRLGRGRRGGRLRFVDVDADQYGPARLAGRSSCRAKSRDQNRQRADNPFRGDSGRDFPPRESWSVGRVHLTCPPWVSPKACLHSNVPPANGNRISRNSVIGRQGPATQGNLQRQFSLIELA